MDLQDSQPVLIIEPSSQVRFSGPFTRPVVTTLTLVNPTDYKIIFKIKTTAPAFYGVRPNFGVVQPRNFAEVEIARQPFTFDPNEHVNHKFMVQSLVAPSAIEDLNSFWENAEPGHLMSSKLRCVFEMPSDEAGTSRTIKLPEMVSSHERPHLRTHERSHDRPQRSDVRLDRSESADRIEKPETSRGSVERSERNDKAHKRLSFSGNDRIERIERTDSRETETRNDRLDKKRESDDRVPKKQLDTLVKELRQLRLENDALRKENLIHKDEIEQLRSPPIEEHKILPNSSNSPNERYEVTMAPVPFIYILSAVTVAVICILIGKFIL